MLKFKRAKSISIGFQMFLEKKKKEKNKEYKVNYRAQICQSEKEKGE
jgi:hypothetical protein